MSEIKPKHGDTAVCIYCRQRIYFSPSNRWVHIETMQGSCFLSAEPAPIPSPVEPSKAALQLSEIHASIDAAMLPEREALKSCVEALEKAQELIDRETPHKTSYITKALALAKPFVK